MLALQEFLHPDHGQSDGLREHHAGGSHPGTGLPRGDSGTLPFHAVDSRPNHVDKRANGGDKARHPAEFACNATHSRNHALLVEGIFNSLLKLLNAVSIHGNVNSTVYDGVFRPDPFDLSASAGFVQGNASSEGSPQGKCFANDPVTLCPGASDNACRVINVNLQSVAVGRVEGLGGSSQPR